MSDTATTVNLPATGTYVVDPTHSEVGFVARHLVSKVRGRFHDFDATIVVGDTPETSSVTAEVRIDSVDTSSADRDAHLRTNDFFDMATHPVMTFASTAVRAKGDDYELVGDLTIKGITRSVTFDLEFLGNATDPWGNTRAAFEATATVDRHDFDLNWNQALETGGVLVGKDVKLVLQVQAVRQA